MIPCISIIVPIYNTEKYLAKCIDSILVQTFVEFELILINDGSTDDCENICDEYAQKDNRIKVIHKENGGVSSARNKGLEIASGKYITFCDSDDWIEKNMLQKVYKIIENDQSDMVIYGFVYDKYEKDKLVQSIPKSVSHYMNISLDEMKYKFRYIFNSIDISSSCNKLFKANILKENRIRYNENIVIYEDLNFNLNVLKCCKNISMLAEIFYHYTQPLEVNYLDKKEKLNLVYDISVVMDNYLDYLKQININKNDSKEIRIYIVTRFTMILEKLVNKNINATISQKLRIIKELAKNETFLRISNDLAETRRYNKLIVMLMKYKCYFLVYCLCYLIYKN